MCVVLVIKKNTTHIIYKYPSFWWGASIWLSATNCVYSFTDLKKKAHHDYSFKINFKPKGDGTILYLITAASPWLKKWQQPSPGFYPAGVLQPHFFTLSSCRLLYPFTTHPSTWWIINFILVNVNKVKRVYAYDEWCAGIHMYVCLFPRRHLKQTIDLPKTQKSPIKIVLTSSLWGEGYLLKVGSLSFGSPVIVSAVSKSIFEIKYTEDETKITTPMFSGSGKKRPILWLFGWNRLSK